MAKRGQQGFLKRQQEIRRKERAAEKMARGQGKAERPKDGTETDQAGDTERRLDDVTYSPISF